MTLLGSRYTGGQQKSEIRTSVYCMYILQIQVQVQCDIYAGSGSVAICGQAKEGLTEKDRTIYVTSRLGILIS